MPRTAARTTAASALLAAAVVAATVAPATARTDALAFGSSTVDLTANGTAFGGYSFPMATGKKVSVRHYKLAPGQVITWGRTPETVIGILADGADTGVTNYLGCRQKQTWKVGHGFYFLRSKSAGTLDGVTVNEGKDPVEIYAIVSEAAGQPQAAADLHTDNGVPENPPAPAGGCPTGEPATMEEIGSGIPTGDGSFRTDDHQGISVYTVKAAPGYSSGWHYLSDPGFLIQTKGDVAVWSNCSTKRDQVPGKAYVNDSQQRSQRITNSGSSAAEFLIVSFNQPDFYPADLGPATPEFPPSDCVDTGIPK